jgi:MFS transporter, FSR family, fosmidomycin resistance protein
MQTITKLRQMPKASTTVYGILAAISIVHMLNDSMQAVIPAIFPILERAMHLSFTQVGWIAFTLSMTSSILQPVIGLFTDKRPSPYLLPLGMVASLVGMLGLAFAPGFSYILMTVAFIGLGSAVFHPEGSRVAHLAAGDRKGLAQAIYQVGGNGGSSLAPIMTALIFVPLGQFGAIWFTILAFLAIIVCFCVSPWYKQQIAFEHLKHNHSNHLVNSHKNHEIKRKIKIAMILLIFLVFARSWASAGISNYYQFYLIKDYGVSITHAQIFLFVFMAAGAVGTILGGPLADRFGKRTVILVSLIGSAPFSILLPHLGLFWVYPVLFCFGAILTSSFSVTVVYAQELIPGKVGMASGLIVGLAFGMGALGAVVLGKLADIYGLYFVMVFCSVLPILGLITFLLPTDKKLDEWTQAQVQG